MPCQIKLKPNRVPTGMGPSPSIILFVIKCIKNNLFRKFMSCVGLKACIHHLSESNLKNNCATQNKSNVMKFFFITKMGDTLSTIVLDSVQLEELSSVKFSRMYFFKKRI